jgi:putative phosphoesterase
MRIVAVSDTHGSRDLLRDAVMQAAHIGRVDVFVHCGDGVRDMEAVDAILHDVNPDVRIYAVSGNCDVSVFTYPKTELFEVNGVRMMVTHGDKQKVKLDRRALLNEARSLGAQVAFFGHTHQPLLEPGAGVMLVNPGQLTHPLRGNFAYAQVLVENDGRYKADLIRWLG